MNDQPLSQKERMSWWVNYVIKHKGNPLTDNMKNKFYGLQRLDVDIVIFLYTCALLSLILSSYLCYKIIKVISFLWKSVGAKEKEA